jgi:hypothetical protein
MPRRHSLDNVDSWRGPTARWAADAGVRAFAGG